MNRRNKNFAAALKQIPEKPLQLQEAIPLVQKVRYAKFDETIEIAMRLGVNPKHADQIVRGTVIMPNGTGKNVKVIVITKDDEKLGKELQKYNKDREKDRS